MLKTTVFSMLFSRCFYETDMVAVASSPVPESAEAFGKSERKKGKNPGRDEKPGSR